MKRESNGALIFHREGKQFDGLVELCVEAMHYEQGRCLHRVADIGANMGESSAIFAVYFKHVYAVDTWAPRDLDIVRRVTGNGITNEEVERSFDIRMNALKPVICKVKYASPEAAGRFPDGFFDLVYIDGSHDYDNVVSDIRAWKVKSRALIGGHDFCDTGDVCRAVVDELGMPQWLFQDSSWMAMV
jgi:SAM-dependent methyltransferase